jgi:hypothetical protein
MRTGFIWLRIGTTLIVNTVMKLSVHKRWRIYFITDCLFLSKDSAPSVG